MKSILAVALLSLASATQLFHSPASAYAVNVAIQPQSAVNPYELLAPRNVVSAHVCTVEVTDLATKTSIVGPKVVLIPGDHATKSVSVAGYAIQLTASISRDAQHASWEVLMRRDGEIVTSQKSDMRLRPTRVER